MPVVHNREELLNIAKTLTDKQYADGILWDQPKARRRAQATNPKRKLEFKIDGDLKRRAATQVNRYVSKLGVGPGWDLMLKLWEHPTDEQLEALARGEEREIHA